MDADEEYIRRSRLRFVFVYIYIYEIDRDACAYIYACTNRLLMMKIMRS
jgi:hypothetical protein